MANKFKKQKKMMGTKPSNYSKESMMNTNNRKCSSCLMNNFKRKENFSLTKSKQNKK